MNQIKRGEIYFADLSPVVGSEQDGVRPVLILQNDTILLPLPQSSDPQRDCLFQWQVFPRK